MRGLMSVTGASSMSYTKIFFCTPICGAASPRPGALYIAWSIACERRTSLPSMFSTSSATAASTGSPYVRMS